MESFAFLQLAFDETKRRKEMEAELEKLKKNHANLEAAWEKGKQTTAKYKQMLIDSRRMLLGFFLLYFIRHGFLFVISSPVFSVLQKKLTGLTRSSR